ncbi:MAG: helix-turn-helix domain-containing protein [Clostridia bacterium]|nr:helix-turn-helix domain-containing protein [Clostridia bacterium]
MPDFLIGALPKGSTYIEPHTHDVSEIILVTEGEGVRTVDNAQLSFHPGSIIIIPPNVPHQSHSGGEYMEIFIQADRPISLGAGNAEDRVLVLEDDEENAVSTLMKMMLYRYIKGGKNDATLSLMFDLVIQLLNEKCVALQQDPVVEEVCRLLALHYNDPQFSVSALLETTGYNKDHIRRRFISVRGVTPSEYLTQLRIKHAKRLLKRKNELQLSVADIGEMCGYYDPHYFSRIFKKETGVTPEKFASLPQE